MNLANKLYNSDSATQLDLDMALWIPRFSAGCHGLDRSVNWQPNQMNPVHSLTDTKVG